ncbi:hypothetical protein P152DRAFT_68855 [Eremomyces bilateralis CBS 781.70]|uniref:Uncharacterized protein n=1 Tax=Eremomyces bilateralis CBS 781.70 TaxID=1392243 RepID=A0A6G1G0G8_9PEZI|nr:uncharacterized protein P152DRAFT_68855 [Eremomyces bilateralis CBS 781.70]KAF1811309.1 hypothetical protein P152DRAFT_68855 [Eremomyces bilateralis CBS 781.70]
MLTSSISFCGVVPLFLYGVCTGRTIFNLRPNPVGTTYPTAKCSLLLFMRAVELELYKCWRKIHNMQGMRFSRQN